MKKKVKDIHHSIKQSINEEISLKRKFDEENKRSLSELNSIEERLKRKQENYHQQVENIIKSRNEYSEKLRDAKTNYDVKSA